MLLEFEPSRKCAFLVLCQILVKHAHHDRQKIDVGFAQFPLHDDSNGHFQLDDSLNNTLVEKLHRNNLHLDRVDAPATTQGKSFITVKEKSHRTFLLQTAGGDVLGRRLEFINDYANFITFLLVYCGRQSIHDRVEPFLWKTAQDVEILFLILMFIDAVVEIDRHACVNIGPVDFWDSLKQHL